jgi:hypothetical protein
MRGFGLLGIGRRWYHKELSNPDSHRGGLYGMWYWRGCTGWTEGDVISWNNHSHGKAVILWTGAEHFSPRHQL